MDSRFSSLIFWGARDETNPLTNVLFDLSMCDEMVCKPAREQDA